MLADLATNATNPGFILLVAALAVLVIAQAVGRRRRANRSDLDYAAAVEAAQYASWNGQVPVVAIEDFLSPPSGAWVYIVTPSYKRAQYVIATAQLDPGACKNIQYPHQLDTVEPDAYGLVRFVVLSDAWEMARAVEVRDRMAEVPGAGFLVLQT